MTEDIEPLAPIHKIPVQVQWWEGNTRYQFMSWGRLSYHKHPIFDRVGSSPVDLRHRIRFKGRQPLDMHLDNRIS